MNRINPWTKHCESQPGNRVRPSVEHTTKIDFFFPLKHSINPAEEGLHFGGLLLAQLIYRACLVLNLCNTSRGWYQSVTLPSSFLLESCGPNATDSRRIKHMQSRKSLDFEVLIRRSFNWQRNLCDGMIQIQNWKVLYVSNSNSISDRIWSLLLGGLVAQTWFLGCVYRGRMSPLST